MPIHNYQCLFIRLNVKVFIRGRNVKDIRKKFFQKQNKTNTENCWNYFQFRNIFFIHLFMYFTCYIHQHQSISFHLTLVHSALFFVAFLSTLDQQYRTWMPIGNTIVQSRLNSIRRLQLLDRVYSHAECFVNDFVRGFTHHHLNIHAEHVVFGQRHESGSIGPTSITLQTDPVFCLCRFVLIKWR